MSPPPFKFNIIKTFQDPLTRQLSEAVRIERRGEDILNSKTEFSRCRVPRLRVDMEGWIEKQKLQVQKAGQTSSVTSSQAGTSSHQEQPSSQKEEDRRLQEDAELSQAERDDKRKAGVQEGRKSKRMRLARVTGWGLQTTQCSAMEQEAVKIGGGVAWTMRTEDWTGAEVHRDSRKQVRVTTWLEGTPKNAPGNLPDGKDTPRRGRIRGKLTKAEQMRMKETHRDIGTFLSSSKKKDREAGHSL